MLIYDDEWVVPGEVEYAERKAAEIEAQIQEYHKGFREGQVDIYDDSIYIQITEHIIGKFEITLLDSIWKIYHNKVTNDMMLRWFRDTIAPIDAPKIFDLPADDIRSSLPEWDESLLPDSARRRILLVHSSLNKVVRQIKKRNDYYDDIEREYGFSDTKCSRIMKTFIDKLNRLDTENKPVTFTELEEEIGKYMVSKDKYDWHGCWDEKFNWLDYWNYYFYAPWNFPLTMSDKNIIDAIHEAYLNASKRSRRIIPDKFDKINMDRTTWEVDSELIELENYECLYQGKARNLLIRFLFDFKDKKIVTAYPVLKEERETGRC